MPAARAAVSREPPSSTSARASIRRAARASQHRAASRRRPPAPSSRRVIATTIGPLPTGPYRRINRRGPRDAPGTRPVRNNGRWYEAMHDTLCPTEPGAGDPRPPAAGRAAGGTSAFRAVMFTDVLGSAEMMARLGDRRAVEIVRAHDALVRRALARHGGREVKHTGDGITAPFADAAAAIGCAQAPYPHTGSRRGARRAHLLGPD